MNLRMRAYQKINKYLTALLIVVSCLTATSCGEYSALQRTTDYDYKYEAAKAYFVEGKYSKATNLLYRRKVPRQKRKTGADCFLSRKEESSYGEGRQDIPKIRCLRYSESFAYFVPSRAVPFT